MFGLVGESGSGKSTTGRCILRLIEPTSGDVRFRGENVLAFSRERMRLARRDMQIVFQDPYSSLNPRMRVRDIVEEPLVIHRLGTRDERRARVAELFELVGLEPVHLERYPHEFSGGQRQRIGIARALALNPALVIADEAVSALDVSIQAQVVALLLDLQARLKLTYLFIAHDLRLVEHICSRVAVMYRGRIVEMGDTSALFAQPHPPLHTGAAQRDSGARPRRAAHAHRARSRVIRPCRAAEGSRRRTLGSDLGLRPDDSDHCLVPPARGRRRGGCGRPCDRCAAVPGRRSRPYPNRQPVAARIGPQSRRAAAATARSTSSCCRTMIRARGPSRLDRRPCRRREGHRDSAAARAPLSVRLDRIGPPARGGAPGALGRGGRPAAAAMVSRRRRHVGGRRLGSVRSSASAVRDDQGAGDGRPCAAVRGGHAARGGTRLRSRPRRWSPTWNDAMAPGPLDGSRRASPRANPLPGRSSWKPESRPTPRPRAPGPSTAGGRSGCRRSRAGRPCGQRFWRWHWPPTRRGAGVVHDGGDSGTRKISSIPAVARNS